jgi:hypothetical protein
MQRSIELGTYCACYDAIAPWLAVEQSVGLGDVSRVRRISRSGAPAAPPGPGDQPTKSSAGVRVLERVVVDSAVSLTAGTARVFGC